MPSSGVTAPVGALALGSTAPPLASPFFVAPFDFAAAFFFGFTPRRTCTASKDSAASSALPPPRTQKTMRRPLLDRCAASNRLAGR